MALDDFKKALKSTNEIELTVTGRKSGKQTSRPVWFVADDGKLYLLPVKGSDTQWYRNVLKNPAISLSAKRVTWAAKAAPIADAGKVRDVVEKFRAAYGAGDVKKYFSKLDVAVEVPLA
jgi:deazaflavin-dependent oxidoreductase (nitroreductase family)